MKKLFVYYPLRSILTLGDWARFYAVNRVRHRARKTRVEVQRAHGRVRHGISGPDVWNLDVFVARTAGRGMRLLADEDRSYPEKNFTAGAWRAALYRHSRNLESYADAALWGHQTEEQVTAAQRAMVFFAENLGDMWD